MKSACLLIYIGITVYACLIDRVYGETPVADSLLQLLQAAEELPPSYSKDTSRIGLMIDLAKEYYQEHHDSLARAYAEAAEALSKKSGHMPGAANSYYVLAEISSNAGNYRKALELYNRELSLRLEMNDTQGAAKAIDNVGLAYYNMGLFDKAGENLFRALTLREKTGDKKGIASSLNHLGLLFRRQNRLDESLAYHFRSLKAYQALQDKKGMAAVYGNIGIVYESKERLDSALVYNRMAMRLNEEAAYEKGMMSALHNLGVAYMKLGKYEEALHHFTEAEKLALKFSNTKALAACYRDMGNVYVKQKKFALAETMLTRGLDLFRQMGQKSGIKDSFRSLAACYREKGDPLNAYAFLEKYASIKDSLFSEENAQQIAEMQTIYETEKKDRQIEIQALQLSGKEMEIQKNHIVIYSAGAGILLLLLLAFFIYRGYQQKQKANVILSEKNILIEKQKEKIVDSINYARMIQRSILPDEKEMKKIFPESFVLFRPKDIVSGDFYWVHREGDLAFAAAVDCTGHGVPGAFMSMIGNTLLKEIIIDKKVRKPSDVLSTMHEEICHLLHQEKGRSSSQDGMDMSLCVLNLKNRTLQFSGAHNSLVLVKGGELSVLPADPHSIGGSEQHETGFEKRDFTCHETKLLPGTSLYLFSDGYADQFGGSPRKKLGSASFKDLLVQNSGLAMDAQHARLEAHFDVWKGKNQQIDDVLVMGIHLHG